VNHESATNEGCERVQRLLHVVIEGEAERSERREVRAHLELCPLCRREMERERTLSALLDPGLRSRGARRRLVAAAIGLAPVGAVASLVLVLAWLLHAPSAYGSIAPKRCLPSLELETGASVPLRAHNHIVVPAREVQTIQIEDEGMLRLVGPAVVELDRTDEGWKLVLLRGQADLDLVPGAHLEVASVHGLRELGGGSYVARLDPTWFARTGGGGSSRDAQDSSSELLARGHRQFFQEEDFVAAEASYVAARMHPDATPDERRTAWFYQLAAVGRQERYEDALELGAAYLEAYPADESATYVLYFQGEYSSLLGRSEEARAAWEALIERDPDSDLAKLARQRLGAPARAAATPGAPEDETGRSRAIPPAGTSAGKPLVVCLDLVAEDLETRRFRDVAEDVASYHHAERLDLSTADLAGLEAALRERRPSAVIYVLRPDSLDVQLHRHLLLLSVHLDEDLFPDFTFGYLTAANGEDLGKLWKRTRAVHEHGLSSHEWRSLFVTGSDASMTYPGYIPGLATAGGFEGEGYGIAVHDKDAHCLEYAADVLPHLEDAGVVSITGNGDPQGIWLFDDHRNIDDSKHWPYDPERVCKDPKGEIPRLLASDFAKLDLERPVVWSGTCHSASTRRVFVEGDIVSTFGVTEKTTVHELRPGESMGLAILHAGAVALLAPIGANHGYSVENEVEFALANGASLGETIKSTWDDVFLQADGELHLSFPKPGDPHDMGAEPIMQGGGANRVLLGDPMLAPFEAVKDPTESVRIENAGPAGFDVVVAWKEGFHPQSWDIYGTDRARDFRITARVPIDALLPEDARSLNASVELTDENGAKVSNALLRHVELEAWNGTRLLHLQVNASRERLDRKAVQARFHVQVEAGPR
jgi:tetratricopeptide (TPR) repeat protein